MSCLRILIALLLLAPSGEAQSTEARDSAGVSVVTSLGAAWESSGWTIEEDPSLEIGVIDGDAAFQFRLILDAVRLPSGIIAVLDYGSKELRFYSEKGEVIQIVGGEGGGPGEFRAPWRIARQGGDTVAVWDYSRRTLAWFAPSDGFLRQQRVRGPRTIHEGELTSDAERLIPHYPVAPDPAPEKGVYRPNAMLVRVAVDSARPDTLTHFQYREMSRRRIPVPFAKDTYIASGGDPVRIAVGDSESFDIRMFEAGAFVLRIRAPSLQRSVDDVDINRYRARIGPRGSPSVQRELRDLDFPERVPAFQSLHVDSEGHVWAELYPDLQGNRVFAVFDPEGVWLGLVPIPDGLVVHDITESYVLGVWKDEFDVEYVRLHRLARH